MTNYTYSKVTAANFNTSPATVARSATGSVYAITDTTYTTPLNMTLVVGGTVVTSISSDANGYFPDFTILDRMSCVWKQSGVAFATVLTTTDPVPGPKGDTGAGTTGPQGAPGDVSTWKPTTFYPLNVIIANPSGDLVTCTTAHTSTGSYDASKFALSATYALKGEGGAEPPTEGFLGQIAKAQTGPFRILMAGTSISTFNHAPNQVIVEWLKTLYGDSGLYVVRGGILGGSLDTPYLGWKRQRYAGFFYQRLRGEAASSQIVLLVSGDFVTLEFSREADSEAANILIDGTVVGTTPAAGAQAYTQKQTFNVAAGVHTVTINPPAGSGYVYFERLGAGLTARKGVEVLDGTMGGSTLGMMIKDAVATGQVLPPIPVVGDVGVDGWMDRTDVDAVIYSGPVNDAGSSPQNTYFETVFKPALDKVVAKTKAARKPLLLIVEMAGHYALLNDAGAATNHTQFVKMRDYMLATGTANNHVTVVDHHGATIMDDLAAYAARYYPAVTGLNVAAGTYTGDFIHYASTAPGGSIGTALMARKIGVQVPRRALADLTAADRVRTLPSTEGRDKRVTISGTAKRYPSAAGMAVNMVGPGTSGAYQYELKPYYRDPSPANLAASLQGLVDASGTSDKYGKYYDMNLQNQGLGSAVAWASGALRTLTVRASGTFSARVGGITNLYANGVLVPRTDVPNDRTEARFVVPDAEPFVFTLGVGATANGGNLAVSGRIYDVSLTDSDSPVLTAEAATGAQGPTGVTGPTGGLGSPLVSGRWSSPTIFGSLSASTPTIDNAYAVPFIPLESGTVDQLGIDITTAAAAGGVVRLGLYNSNANHQPANLLVDAGTVDATATGWKKPAAFTGVPLVAGQLYWLVCVPQVAAPGVRTVSGFTPMVTTADNPITGATGYTLTLGASAPLNAAWGTTFNPASIAPFMRAHVV